MKDELDLLPATDKLQRFLQIAIIMSGLSGRHAQITQNDKFATSLQYLKELSDEVDFLEHR